MHIINNSFDARLQVVLNTGVLRFVDGDAYISSENSEPHLLTHSQMGIAHPEGTTWKPHFR